MLCRGGEPGRLLPVTDGQAALPGQQLARPGGERLRMAPGPAVVAGPSPNLGALTP